MSKKDFCQNVLVSFWGSISNYRKAVIWQVLSNLSFALMAVAIKKVGEEVNSFEIVFFRCLIALFILAPFLFKIRLKAIKTKYFTRHLTRAFFGFFASIIDSLLGATLESRGILGNGGVNFCSIALTVILSLVFLSIS